MKINYKKTKKTYIKFIDEMNKIIPAIVEYHVKMGNVIKKEEGLFYKDSDKFDVLNLLKSIDEVFKSEVGIDINVLGVIGKILNINIQNEKKGDKKSNKKRITKEPKTK